MIKPELSDVVELLVDLPEHNLPPGVQGAIVHCHPDDTYQVEFTNEDGETVALCPLSADQFIVVWQAETRTWLPMADQIVALIAHRPEDAGREVLDCVDVIKMIAAYRAGRGESLGFHEVDLTPETRMTVSVPAGIS